MSRDPVEDVVRPVGESESVTIKRVPVTSVCVTPERRASLREPVVELLVESLKRRGLLSPIRLRHDGELVCGLHRVVAHERLGWTEIAATVLEHDDPFDAELDEIEENLCRKELSVLERARDERRQKELYLLRNPATRQGIAGATVRHEGMQAKGVSFAEARAGETGSSRRMIEQRIQIATSLRDEDAAKLSSLPIADNHTQLLELARLPDAVRPEVIERIADGKATRVKQALGQIVAPASEKPARPERLSMATGPMVETASGYRGEAVVLGQRMIVEFGRDHREMVIRSDGPAPVQRPTPEPRRLTTALSFALVREVVDELPSDLASLVTTANVFEDPARACEVCGEWTFYRDDLDHCAHCHQRRHYMEVELFLATFSRRHPRKRQRVTVVQPAHPEGRILEITWSRGADTNRERLASFWGWDLETIPATETEVELRSPWGRRSWVIESNFSPGVDRFKSELLRQILVLMAGPDGHLQRRGERFFRRDGTEVLIVRGRG